MVPARSPSEIKTSDDLALPVEPGSAFLFGRIFVAVGLAALLLSVALSIRTYMPCPFWDEWAFINAIANGAGPASWGWLWSQHNEHRLLVTRLLILCDLRVFGGANRLLFAVMFLAQGLQLAAICYALGHSADFPRYLKFTLGGLFAFCLFHLNQAENFTWAFQSSFVLAFCITSLALLALAFFDRWNHPAIVTVGVALAPLLAACNVSGALLIGPVLVAYAVFKRLPARYVLLITAIFAATAAGYFIDYRTPQSQLSPVAALGHPKEIAVYVLTYFGASWTKLVPHKERLTCFLSFVALLTSAVLAVRNKKRTTAFEWFCLAQCLFLIAVAVGTALGRLQFGVGQAFAGRYQTPAMLYWASICSLLLIAVWRYRRERFLIVQAFVMLVLIASLATFIPLWRSNVSRGDRLANACAIVMNGNNDERAARLLYGSPQDVAPGVAYLHRVWGH